MLSLFTFTAPPDTCGYLPDRDWRLQYDIVGEATPAEYLERMHHGWRRFGHSFFRPVCESCQLCQPLRIPVGSFQPNRSQRRVAQLNEGSVTLTIGTPNPTRENLALYDRYHRFQHQVRGWPEHAPKDEASYIESFVQNPFPTQEWAYRVDGQLVGVGYVDALPTGLSAIYFFHEPAERHRSLGVWNILSLLRVAESQALPHVYLGYYVPGCPSMEYKTRFRPHERLSTEGLWTAPE